MADNAKSPSAGPPQAGLGQPQDAAALQPSMPAQAGMEPRLSFPAGDRLAYATAEGPT